MTHQFNQPQPAPQPPKKQTPTGVKVLVVVAIVVVALTWLGSCGAIIASMGDDPEVAAPSPSAPSATAPPATEAPKTKKSAKPKPKPEETAAADTVGDGDYLVGREIKTGTWKAAEVPDEGRGLCYADTETKKGDILEQEIASDGESVIIRIKPNAYTFSSSGCGTWRRIDD